MPALVLAGEVDPSTSLAWGDQLLRTMPNARFVVMPAGVMVRCPIGGQLTLAFLRDPNAPLPIDCVAKMLGANFGADIERGH